MATIGATRGGVPSSPGRPATGEQQLTPADVVKFTAAGAAFAIFVDAAIGHGLLWENDPYWTYWITKTFLIATVFGLGTALIGIGVARGAIITAVHTVVLTVYYWSFSPIGLPSSPEWLDLEHTWTTGLPVHFGVIYAGYLLALWIWRRRQHAQEDATASTRTMALAALGEGLLIVIVAGMLASLALWELPGFTWFLVRLLITVPFLMGLWAIAGRDLESALLGGATLAFVWATYGHFLGPVGLPDWPLRIFDPDPPGATSHWLSYTDLWLISLPIYAATILVVLVADVMLRGSEEPSA